MFDIKPEWIPLITTLAGALIGYITAIITVRRAEKSEDRKIFILKLEEMHEVVRSIRQQYIEFYNDNLNSIMFDKERDLEGTGKLEIDRLEMLATFYFPETIPQINDLNIRRVEVGKVISEIILHQMKHSQSDKLISEFTRKCILIDEACVSIFEKLSSIAHKRLKIKS
jgi:hypothetical protein